MRRALQTQGFADVPQALLNEGVLVAQALAANRPPNDVMFALNGFYSPVIRAAENFPQPKATPEQWKAVFRGANVPQEQVRWIGLNDWLDSETAKTISKNDMLGFLAEHQIELDEVEKKPEDDLRNDPEIQKRAQEIYDANLNGYIDEQSERGYEPSVNYDVYERNADDGGGWTYTLHSGTQFQTDSQESEDVFDSEDEAETAAYKAQQELEDELRSNWADEVRNDASEDVSWNGAIDEAIKESNRATSWHELDMSQQGEKYRELLIRFLKLAAEGYSSAHFNDTEIVHIRYDIRRDPVTGRLVLFIHEIQSDLHQHARGSASACS